MNSIMFALIIVFIDSKGIEQQAIPYIVPTLEECLTLERDEFANADYMGNVIVNSGCYTVTTDKEGDQ